MTGARATVIAALLAMTAGCSGCEDRSRNEAELFLSRVGDIDENDPLPQRTAEVRALERLVVTTDEVRHAKDTCVHAHASLLRAEAEQSSARDALARATEGQGAAAQLTAADQRAIQASIDASNTAIAEARDSFPACQRAIRDLERRYGARHAP